MKVAIFKSKKAVPILVGRAIGLGMLILALLLFPLPALADIAPPDRPPGANILPGDTGTQVRMLAESVLIDVLGNTPTGSLGQARVTARFTMQNLGNTDEKMRVRFPLNSIGSDEFGQYPEVKDFSARVQGRTVPVRRAAAEGSDGSGDGQPWVEFEATFPAGKDVLVDVSYLTEGVGEYPFVAFKYILETGAGWRDTIGQADLTLRLPYEANNQNVIFDEQIGWSQTTPGSSLVGREVRWKLRDFEPDMLDNLEISLIMPSVWKKVLEERANVTRNPDDGEAWGRLGKLYKEIISYRRGLRQDPGGQDLLRLSVVSYEKALALLPKDALWHAGFADLLYRKYYWGEYFKENPNHADMLRALDEFRLALELDPDNPKTLEFLDEMKYAVPEAVRQEDDHFVFLWLTATPTARPPDTATPTASPVLASLTPTPGQSKSAELPLPKATPTVRVPPVASPAVVLTDVTSTPSERLPVSSTETPAITPGGRVQVCGASIGMLAILISAGVLLKRRRWRK